MQIHELKIKYKHKKIKRVGRGGKRGTYSGRGSKGQKSRAGHKIRPAERDLIQRLPKLRGFNFKSLKAQTIVVNLRDLEAKAKDNIINLETLIKNGLIRKGDRVKILGVGEVKRAFEIEGLEISESAKNKIEAAGGKIKTLPLASRRKAKVLPR